jgi:flagellar FliJ protein
MTNKKGLQTIQTLAESTETMRSRIVSDQRFALREEESRLEQLERYRTEYQSMSNNPEQGTCIHFVRGRRSFVQKLNEAIDNQRQVIVRKREQLDMVMVHWRDARAKALSLQKFAERIAAQEDQKMTRREQAELDDIGRKKRSELNFG